MLTSVCALQPCRAQATQSPPLSQNNDAALATDGTTICFPLKKDDIYFYFNYIIDLNDTKVIAQYAPMFQKYNYKFTGYVWESILKQILSDADNDLSTSVFLKRDSKMVGFRIIRYDMGDKFAAYMCKIFSDKGKIFEAYLKTANRDKVNNY